MKLQILYNAFMINPNTYFICIGFILVILIIFWIAWCRERVLILGIVFSFLVVLICIFVGVFILYRLGDPGVITVSKVIGIVDQDEAVKKYLDSSYFKIVNEQSWRALNLINQDWKKQPGVISQEELINLLESTQSVFIGKEAAVLLDKLNPKWRNGEIGKRISSSIVGRLSSGAELTKDDQKYLNYLNALEIGTVELSEYLKTERRGTKIAIEIASLLNTLDPGWKKEEIGKQISQSIFKRISKENEASAVAKLNFKYMRDLGFSKEDIELPSVLSSLVPFLGNDWRLPLTNQIAIRMKWIEPGRFVMGRKNRFDENYKNPFTIELKSGFWIGIYEVTQEQWAAVMRNNPSKFKNSGMNAPVENITWEDADWFCKKLNAIEKKARRIPEGYEYGLPTEAQWEYACRARSDSVFNNGNSSEALSYAAWYKSNSKSITHTVGQKKPNKWKLYDMHGNVWEWCNDWYGGYPAKIEFDYLGPATGKVRICRGGSWNTISKDCSSTYRNYNRPLFKSSAVGFRLSLRTTIK